MTRRCYKCNKPKSFSAFVSLEKNLCKTCRNAYETQKRLIFKTENRCKCGRPRNLDDRLCCQICKARNDYNNNLDREARRLYAKARRQYFKKCVFDHYGRRCACPGGCNITEEDMLTVDHIENNGAQHRRELGIKSGSIFYRWLVENNFPPGFRILCYNCNCSRARVGVCPHERRRKQPLASFPLVHSVSDAIN